VKIKSAILVAIAATTLAACTSPEAKLAKEHAALIATAQDAVANELRDPDSAKFRNVMVGPRYNTVCGQVSGKNAFGGYAQPIRFTYHDIDGVKLEDAILAGTNPGIRRLELCILENEHRQCAGEEVPSGTLFDCGAFMKRPD